MAMAIAGYLYRSGNNVTPGYPHKSSSYKMRSVLSLLTLALAAVSAAAVPLDARVTPAATTCAEYGKYIGIHDGTNVGLAGCTSLTDACLKANGTSIWSHSQCVAAAACQGTLSVITLSQCENNKVLAASSIPNLSGAVWTSIVGTGAVMTQQNFIDFVYGAMSAAEVTTWPSYDDVVKNWWDPIVAWTATGETIPYKNFNDWLHWSNS
ncbi:hypothetical protein C8F01DRAFT_1370031 [Mycena amicta]|nr:hypothetical protein C8F01DRAFT_1370031 [Mycena amicta]